jgi:hypothetical protein
VSACHIANASRTNLEALFCLQHAAQPKLGINASAADLAGYRTKQTHRSEVNLWTKDSK